MSDSEEVIIVASRSEIIHLNEALTSYESFLHGELDDDDLDDMFSTVGSILSRNKMTAESLYAAKSPHSHRRFAATGRDLNLLHKGVVIMAYMDGGSEEVLSKQVKNAFKAFQRIYQRNKLSLPEPNIQYVESVPDIR